MEQPPGFKDPNHPDHVCEVHHSIYGLKQAPCQWNKELHQEILDSGLTQSKYNPTLYFKVLNDRLLGAITVHVDDLDGAGEDSFVDSSIWLPFFFCLCLILRKDCPAKLSCKNFAAAGLISAIVFRELSKYESNCMPRNSFPAASRLV
jgi:hypothetical protein